MPNNILLKAIIDTVEELQLMYCSVKKNAANSSFLLEIKLADNMEIDRLKEALSDNHLTVFIQDEIIKIPSKNYTTQKDLQNLVNCFRLCVSF